MPIQVTAGPAPRPIDEAAVAALRGPSAVRIPAGLRVQGEAHYPCDVRLDGALHGLLTLDNGFTLLVTEHGKATGTVTAGSALVEGSVEGTIDCSHGAVEFTATARCTARVLYRELSVARGAEVEAQLQRVGARRG